MKKPIIPILILTTLFATALIANATLPPLSPPPVGGYDSGSNSILDPGCAPGTPNCWVNLPSGGSGWSLTGNSGTTAGTNFIGTTDAVDFVIKVNGNEMGRFYENTGTSQYSVALGGGQALSANMFVYGNGAGYGATGASYSNFLGPNAGINATNASYSNFFGQSAGYGATGAYQSNFFGQSAGSGATNASGSNFLGLNAGYSATSASSSNFLGYNAGYSATSASNSNFLGSNSGNYGTNASNSNFFGNSAGSGASGAYNSNFFGYQAGYNATSANNSNFFGRGAGSGAVDAYESNFSGYQAGMGATGSYYSNFFGRHAGYQAIDSYDSNFFGTGAGYQAVNVDRSNFFGNNSGYKSSGAINSNFFGYTAGALSGGASNSNFFGYQTGYSATSASSSNFFGPFAGSNATDASSSNFFGPFAGSNAPNASNSIFIGQNSGYNDTVNNTGDSSNFSILLGPNTSTGGFSNSIALGGSATNTTTNQLMIGSTTSPINETKIIGSLGTECTITTGTGIACTSDERLKTNITEFTNSDILQKLQNIKTVSYNWKENPNSPLQIGFLAQNLEQQFPELVITDATGKKQVYYSQMTPILVAAVKELNLKLSTLELANGTTSTNIFDSLKDWLGNLENGITDIYAKVFHADRVETKELCVGQTCLNEQQIQHIIQSVGVSATSPSVTQNDTNHPSDSGNNSTNNDTTIPGSEGASSDQPITSDATSNPDPEVNPTNNSTE